MECNSYEIASLIISLLPLNYYKKYWFIDNIVIALELFLKNDFIDNIVIALKLIKKKFFIYNIVIALKLLKTITSLIILLLPLNYF